MKEIKKNQQGQNLIEVIFTLALFFVFIVGTMMLSFRYLKSSVRSIELNNVNIITQQTWSAVEAIAYNDWSDITEGTYGLSNIAGSWAFSGNSDIIKSKYTRAITISATERDEDCNLVESDGENDPDTKKVTLNLDWPSEPVNKTFSSERYFSNWMSPTFTCSATEAGKLVIDTIGSNIDATRKSIIGTVIRNESDIDITIDKMILTWTKPGNIIFIKINGTNYWHSSSGIGSPTGAQSSGVEIDIVDFVLSAGESYDVDIFRFDDKVDGSIVTITATMSDGSQKTEVTTPPFNP